MKPSGNKKKDAAARRKPEAARFKKTPRQLLLHRPLREARALLPASDCWRPSHEGRFVELTMHEDAPKSFRLAFWGADDMGMERVFADEAEMRALAASTPVPVTVAWLKANGFKKA